MAPARDYLATGQPAEMNVTGKVSKWHISEGALWSAHEAVSGPSFHLLFVTH
jgi:hypothetical protein